MPSAGCTAKGDLLPLRHIYGTAQCLYVVGWMY